MDMVIRKQRNWFIGIFAIALLGNVLAYYLMRVLLNYDLRTVPLVLLIFTTVPIAVFISSKKNGLLQKMSTYFEGTLFVNFLSFAVWVSVIWIWLQNAFPDMFY